VHLLENHPDFDGLPESDLVSEECLAVHLEESAVSGVYLMFEEFDVLLVEVKERTEFRVWLASLESIRLNAKEMFIKGSGLSSISQ
jgi:hypothetical protein